MSADQLERVRRLCLALPETSERLSHGEPTFFVGKKVFVMFANNHHHDGRIAIWLPVPPGFQEGLLESSPQLFFRPAYVGHRGWVGIELSRISDADLAMYIQIAWDLIAPKRLRTQHQLPVTIQPPDMSTQRSIPLLEQPVQHLLDLLATSAPRIMIAIAGVPGSGKSTLAARLAAEVNAHSAPDTVTALGMDGFHLTKAELRQLPDPAEAFARRGAPWTFDVHALQQRLQELRAAAGHTELTWPGFEHEIGDPVEATYTIPASTRLIIVEGLYLLGQDDGWQAVCELFDERWFLDTPLETSLQRLALRHMQAWGISREAAEHRIATSDRLNALLVQKSAQSANWLVR